MTGPSITPHQFNMYSSQISDIYVALENELFLQIAKRLKAPPELGKDHVLQWQAEKMRQLRMLNLETIEALAKTTGIARTEIEALFADVGIKSINSIDNQMELNKFKAIPLPSEIDRVLESYVKQTFLEIDNFVNQTLITTNLGEGIVTRTYRKIVEETTAQVLAGNKTINQMVATTVVKWGKQGLKTGFVDKGGRTWHMEHYVDTVIRSTVNNTYNELRLSRMDEYGVDLVVVNSYAGARPACAKIQGGVCSMSNPSSNPKYPSAYEFGYGTPAGLRGINCRHILYPFVEGVNTNNQIQVDEDKANAEYKLMQEQRHYERQVKDAKRSLNLAMEVGDENTINRYKKQVRERQAAVREFVEEHGLARRYDKERVINIGF